VPLVLVEIATRKWVEYGAGLYCDIGDDETLMVERQVAVDGLGEDTVTVVEKEYQKEDKEREETELDARPDLECKLAFVADTHEQRKAHDSTGHGVHGGLRAVLDRRAFIHAPTTSKRSISAAMVGFWRHGPS